MVVQHLQLVCFPVAVNMIAADYGQRGSVPKVTAADFTLLLYSGYYIVTKTAVYMFPKQVTTARKSP